MSPSPSQTSFSSTHRTGLQSSHHHADQARLTRQRGEPGKANPGLHAGFRSRVGTETDRRLRRREADEPVELQVPWTSDFLVTIEAALMLDQNLNFFEGAWPNWEEGRTGQASQTEAEAHVALKETVDRLRRLGRDNPAAQALADRLERAPRAPTLASPVFARAFQKAGVAITFDAIEKLLGDDVLVVSAIYREAGAWMGGLQSNPFAVLKRQLGAALHAAGISTAIGGFDLSALEHQDRAFRPHYRPRAMFFVKASEFRAGEKVFRSFFPSSTTVPRPIRAVRYDGRVNASAFCLRPNFWRRVTIEPMADAESRQKTFERRSLRVNQEVEITLVFDQMRPIARMILYGVRFTRSVDDELVLARR